MYVILDIESSGGQYDEEGITEIAIYQHDGHQVTDQFISLVNPLRPIDPFVEKLTGINIKMLKNAPKFHEVAKRIIEITEDCVLVAHNAEFDYRILQTEFRRLGYDFQRKTLCTVNLSKVLLPEQEAYSLGKLVRNLGIPISDQHRAYGDAKATVKLFELLLEKDVQKDILKEHIETKNPNRVPTKYLSILDKIPTKKGVFYVHDQQGQIIFIESSRNIKKKVLYHLTGKQPKNISIQKKLKTVTFSLTGNSLIALLKEQLEIKKNQPELNQSKKEFFFPFGITTKKIDHYEHLFMEKRKAGKTYFEVFRTKKQTRQTLIEWSNEFGLCLKKTNHFLGGVHNELHAASNCNGACEGKESPEDYNRRLDALEEGLKYPIENGLVIMKGRLSGEYSFVFIEDNVFKGYGYYELNHQIKNKLQIRSRLIEMDENFDTRCIIRSYLLEKRYLKLIYLEKE